jgi:hypothetical protein
MRIEALSGAVPGGFSYQTFVIELLSVLVSIVVIFLRRPLRRAGVPVADSGTAEIPALQEAGRIRLSL